LIIIATINNIKNHLFYCCFCFGCLGYFRFTLKRIRSESNHLEWSNDQLAKEHASWKKERGELAMQTMKVKQFDAPKQHTKSGCSASKSQQNKLL
jgi:hypothetical protein